MKADTSRENYNIISFICFTIVAIPIILILYQGSEVRLKDKYPGMVHIEPGKLFVKNKEAATSEPKNQPILIAENLNKYVASLILERPAYRGLLLDTEINKVLNNLKEAGANPPLEEISRATSKSVRWSPTIGSHGLFYLDPLTPPNNPLTFGTVELTSGKELTTYQTEKRVNSLLYEYRKQFPKKNPVPNTVASLMQEILKQPHPTVSSSEAIDLIGLCYGLNIKYNPDIELFGASESKPEILAWQESFKD